VRLATKLFLAAGINAIRETSYDFERIWLQDCLKGKLTVRGYFFELAELLNERKLLMATTAPILNNRFL
jgi:hypothetical protein